MLGRLASAIAAFTSCSAVTIPSARLYASHCAVALLAIAPTVAEARGRRGGGRRPRGKRYAGRKKRGGLDISTGDVVLFLIISAGFGGVIIGWCVMMEHRPRLDRLRSFLIFAAVLAALLDVGLIFVGVLGLRMGIMLLLCGCWGNIDAALRFPNRYDIATPFVWKQIFLLVARVPMYGFGFLDLWNCKIWFFAVNVMNLFLLPLLYAMSTPMNASEEQLRLAKLDVVDVDVGMRVCRFLTDPSQWRQSALACRLSCQRWMHQVSPAKGRTKSI